MPYILPSVIHDASFTPWQSDDVATACSLLVEKWETFYPEVDYFMIDYTPTVPVDKGESLATGERPATIVDPLYGEAVPVRDLGAGAWEIIQPHGSSSEAMEVDAPSRKRHKDPLRIHVHVARAEPNPELTLEGTNTAREFTLTIPTALLDVHGIVVKSGDRIRWGVNLLELKEVKIRGYWKWTNIPLYVVAEASIEATGS